MMTPPIAKTTKTTTATPYTMAQVRLQTVLCPETWWTLRSYVWILLTVKGQSRVVWQKQTLFPGNTAFKSCLVLCCGKTDQSHICHYHQCTLLYWWFVCFCSWFFVILLASGRLERNRCIDLTDCESSKEGNNKFPSTRRGGEGEGVQQNMDSFNSSKEI